MPKVDGNNIAQFDAVRRRVARPQGGGECPAKLQHQLAEVTEAELRRPKSERVGPINKIGTRRRGAPRRLLLLLRQG